MIYDILAGYYDDLVRDDEATKQWVDWIESYNPKKDFLELACGTGEITLQLAKNHQVSALDLADHMVEAAKAKDIDHQVDFQTGDMRDLSKFGEFDAIGCFCDSFNYLLEEEEVRAFFKEVKAHLREDGLFFFDSHALARIDEFALDHAYSEAGTFEDGTNVQWEIASTPEGLIYQDFAFYLPDQTIAEHHIQRVYDPEWLIQVVKEDFEILSLTTDWEIEGADEGEKYFFVCKKK